MAYKLIPRVTQGSDWLIDWVSREKNVDGKPIKSRVPEPKKHEFSKFTGFIAAGRPYPFTGALRVLIRNKEKGIFWDIYGRKVLHLRKRFPCFDSFDRLHENRYYHWAYLFRKGRLTCIYWEDEEYTIEVTEDVRVIPHWAWKAMEEAGFIKNKECDL